MVRIEKKLNHNGFWLKHTILENQVSKWIRLVYLFLWLTSGSANGCSGKDDSSGVGAHFSNEHSGDVVTAMEYVAPAIVAVTEISSTIDVVPAVVTLCRH